MCLLCSILDSCIAAFLHSRSADPLGERELNMKNMGLVNLLLANQIPYNFCAKDNNII